MKRGVITVMFLILCSLTSAQTITRSFNTTTLCFDDTVLVTLQVSVGTADAYAIDETIPSGWSVEDPGIGSTQHAGHLKWVVIGDDGNTNYNCTGLNSCTSIQDTSYTYALRAPSIAGTSSLSGVYLFDVGSSHVLGPDSLIVQLCTTACSDYSTQASCNSAVDNCSWCSLDAADPCKPSSQVQCTSLECFNSTHECRSTCQLVSCGSGKFCNMTSDLCENIPSGYVPPTPPPTCRSSWSCTDWTPAICPVDTRRQNRTCSDTNNCNISTDIPITSRTCRLPRGTSLIEGGNTTTIVRTRGTSGSTGSTRSIEPTGTTGSRSKTSSDRDATPREPKTSEEVLEENEKTANNLFYILAGIMVVLLIAGGFYYKGKGGKISFNKVNMSSQKKFIQQQSQQPNQQQNKWRSM